MSRIVYLDNAATTSPDIYILNEINRVNKEFYGNPSSIYALGQESADIICQAQLNISLAINSNLDDIIFTSGGTESNNLAILGTCALYPNKKHIITSSIEHLSVLNCMKHLEKSGYEITYLQVDKNGMIDLNILESSIKDNTVLISIMFINNEIGSMQEIKEIGKIARKYNIKFHCDAVQAISHYSIDVEDMNIDLLSISGHKIHTPKGIGCLYVRDNDIDRILYGGHQQNDKRPGTENTAYIHGLGIAIKNIERNQIALINLKRYLIHQLSKIENISFNGNSDNSLSFVVNFRIPNVNNEDLIIRLGLRDICVSGGSACNGSQLAPSHVLKAIGLTDEQCKESIRISLGINNTEEDIDIFVEQLKTLI